MRHVPIRRPLFFGGASSPLLGATWARDGNGRAYNTPTLGSELVVNGDFSSATGWTTTWTISAGVASTTGNSKALQRSIGAEIGKWYRIGFDIIAYTSGFWYLSAAGFSATVTLPNTVGANTTVVARATSANDLRFISDGSAGWAGTIDNVSAKALSLPTTHAYRLGTSNSQIAAARINALTAGTQAGAFALVDNPANPQNGIYAYHDGTGVTLDKLVAGTWSNVVSRVTLAFSAEMEVVPVPVGGNQWQLWAGGSQRGSTVTISDASIVNNQYYGLFSTYSANLFSGFTLDGKAVPFGF